MSSPVFILLISKFSKACNAHLQTISTIKQHGFPLHILDIDHPDTRNIILQSGIKTVPTMALKNGEHIQYFTDEKVGEILKFMENKVLEKNNQINGATILDELPSETIQSNEKDEQVGQFDMSNVKQIHDQKVKKRANLMRHEREENKLDFNDL